MTTRRPMTAEEFGERLARLVSDASSEGVDVRGAWTCPGADGAEWQVEVTRVARSDADAGSAAGE